MQIEIIGILAAARLAVDDGNRWNVHIYLDINAALLALQSMTMKSYFTMECRSMLNNWRYLSRVALDRWTQWTQEQSNTRRLGEVRSGANTRSPWTSGRNIRSTYQVTLPTVWGGNQQGSVAEDNGLQTSQGHLWLGNSPMSGLQVSRSPKS